MNVSEFVQNPLFGIALTVLAYVLALGLQRRWRWLHPLFVCAGVVIVILLVSGVSYSDYHIGGSYIEFFLGPATVALGVPLYKNAQKIKKGIGSILAGITVGSVAGIASSAALVWAFGGTRELMLTMMPKSVSTPISIEIVRAAGGIPELGAVLTVLTGLIGSMIGPEVLKWFGISGDMAIGTAIGTSAHGIGTARLIRESELKGGISGFSMGLAGIITSILFIPLYRLFH
ncbi:LrgB family protein [Paenibacillus thalictri]|uniref:LrgB family protein n=1 Tax=Paenibacillus thalictri TaxID=2527873 RepID=A0A4V2J4K3_9BACL|nr:LrgB family protein [Paenibacillus thalictri]TBL80221.1 LrgB family protein [Paenibacillus thalictri]